MAGDEAIWIPVIEIVPIHSVHTGFRNSSSPGRLADLVALGLLGGAGKSGDGAAGQTIVLEADLAHSQSR